MRFCGKRVIFKVQEVKCTNCGAWCQGWTAPNGKILCVDCHFKLWGKYPWD